MDLSTRASALTHLPACLQAGGLDVFGPRYHLRGRVSVVEKGSGLVRLPLTGDDDNQVNKHPSTCSGL